MIIAPLAAAAMLLRLSLSCDLEATFGGGCTDALDSQRAPGTGLNPVFFSKDADPLPLRCVRNTPEATDDSSLAADPAM